MIDFSERNITLTLGNEKGATNIYTGIVGAVYDVAQLSASAISSALSDKKKYPYYARTTNPSDGMMMAIRDTILHYSDIGGIGWSDIGIITHTDGYGTELAEAIIRFTESTIINVISYQQFLFQSFEFDIELTEISKSGARVLLGFVYSTTWESLVVAADSHGLVGENYVWFVSPSLVGSPVFINMNDDIARLSQGIVGVFDYIPFSGKVYDEFYEKWISLDQTEYPGSGTPPTAYTLLEYDSMIVAGLAADILQKQGKIQENTRITAQDWFDAIKQVKCDCTSGIIRFDEQGDRVGNNSMNYFDAQNREWKLVSLWSKSEGYQPINDIVWYSNTTELPDLDIRPPFDYWSCHDKKQKTDPTGKTISLQTPDGSDIDEIDSNYHCDQFIDCKNMSDETSECNQNYLILFILFGIITGVLILICISILIFVIIFGIFLKYSRLRSASPIFLILILISIIMGFISIYAWFGKPHPVACGFQPWLLGLSTISMVILLSVKNLRIWRIFRSELKRKKITDIELFFQYILLMIPALIILTIWTIIATPTAKMSDDFDDDHYICATGGFIGQYGGYIFFSIFVAYCLLILLFGAFMSIVTRNVPSIFNESKLLAISIYNLGFLAAVIIPVFLVVNPINPFAAWIIRTCAILYAFSATLLLQFFPPIFGIIVLDRLKNKEVRLDISTSTNGTSSKVSKESKDSS